MSRAAGENPSGRAGPGAGTVRFYPKKIIGARPDPQPPGIRPGGLRPQINVGAVITRSRNRVMSGGREAPECAGFIARA